MWHQHRIFKALTLFLLFSQLASVCRPTLSRSSFKLVWMSTTSFYFAQKKSWCWSVMRQCWFLAPRPTHHIFGREHLDTFCSFSASGASSGGSVCSRRARPLADWVGSPLPNSSRRTSRWSHRCRRWHDSLAADLAEETQRITKLFYDSVFFARTTTNTPVLSWLDGRHASRRQP